MKTPFAPLLVVEGITDVAFLQSFLDAEFITTNGSDVPRETIDYIKEVIKTRDVVVLTDPDSPGKRIRDVLNAEIPNLLHAYINKEDAIKKHKVGVAESSPEVVLEALSFALEYKGRPKGNLTYQDLYECGLTGCDDATKNREKVAKTLHLGHGNAKALLKRINLLGISKQQIKEALNHE